MSPSPHRNSPPSVVVSGTTGSELVPIGGRRRADEEASQQGGDGEDGHEGHDPDQDPVHELVVAVGQ